MFWAYCIMKLESAIRIFNLRNVIILTYLKNDKPSTLLCIF